MRTTSGRYFRLLAPTTRFSCVTDCVATSLSSLYTWYLWSYMFIRILEFIMHVLWREQKWLKTPILGHLCNRWDSLLACPLTALLSENKPLWHFASLRIHSLRFISCQHIWIQLCKYFICICNGSFSRKHALPPHVFSRYIYCCMEKKKMVEDPDVRTPL